MRINQDELPQYIDPQHTEKKYQEHQFEQCYATPRMPNGLPSPCWTTPASNTRGLTINISADSTNNTTGSSPISSMESGSSGFITPCSLSNASSRRHSLLVPDSSQHRSFGSAKHDHGSPTPGPRPRSIRSQIEQSHSTMSSFFSSYSDGMCNVCPHSLRNSSFSSGISSDDILMGEELYRSKPPTVDWQSTISTNPPGSIYAESLQIPVPCLSMDLTAGFNASLVSPPMDPRQLAEQHPSLVPFHSQGDQASRNRCIMPSQAQYTPLPALAEAFSPTYSDLFDRTTPSPTPSPRSSRPKRRSGCALTSPSRRYKVAAHEPESLSGYVNEAVTKVKKAEHKCSEDNCNRWFVRQEHCKRHENTHKPGKMLPCPFSPDRCKKHIKDREDNLKAHVQNCHFKYGKSERGAKQTRVDMKASVERGLRSLDKRWDALLGPDFRELFAFGNLETRYWKMIGYSIRETEELEIKSLDPNWAGPDGTKLKERDPRWIKLLDGTMTFEQAMETTFHMLETEKEGILGVDMMGTKEMGLQELDPRWKKLMDGSMSVEESEKLGVKHLNLGGAQKPKMERK